MVDFNDGNTISTPAINIVKVSILQAQSFLFEALEEFNKNKFHGSEPSQCHIRARLITWFLHLQAYLERTLTDKQKEKFDFEGLKQAILSDNEIDEAVIYELIFFLNNKLDQLHITKIDTKKDYNRSNVEEDNEAHGY